MKPIVSVVVKGQDATYHIFFQFFSCCYRVIENCLVMSLFPSLTFMECKIGRLCCVRLPKPKDFFLFFSNLFLIVD